MERFRRERFNIAIDDFGTGHASLSNLVKFPFNRIKIDRSLIKNIDKKWRDATLVKNILVLAKELDITVTAEGIETENIHNHLKEIGCEYAQGQYYAHPMTLDDYLCWIKNYQAIESNKPSLPQTSILVKIADPLSIS
jgi:EAL domain-containing protein (putative c-di-GMP-specific phosphodiesterase class I)